MYHKLIMKRILLLFAATLVAANLIAAPKKQYKYVDAADFTVVNKGHNNGQVYHRVDTLKYPTLTPRMKQYFSFPTGIALRFRTNSPEILAKWKTRHIHDRYNTPATATKGLDLYIMKDGKWLWAGLGRPKSMKKDASCSMVANMDDSMKECLLYLPLFDELDELEIGVTEDAIIESDGGFKRAPIVAMGSSYTHGAANSRPGMPWPAQLSRRLGVDIANFGTSGICKLEPVLADIIADTDADMFIFDTFSNPSAKEIHERFVPFVKRVREAHPNTPLVFLQTFMRDNANFDMKNKNFEDAKRKAAEEELEAIMKTDKNIYFLNPGLYNGDDRESTADGTHPSDLGYYRAVNNIEPKIREIMKKYNIK